MKKEKKIGGSVSIKPVSSHLPSEDVNVIVNCQFVIIIVLSPYCPASQE